MWTEEKLIADLRDIGLTEGQNVLAHTSLRAVGKIEGGAQTLLNAFRKVLGPSGTLVTPTFTDSVGDPAEWRCPPRTEAELERQRQLTPVFDPSTTPADTRWMGVFPEVVRRAPDAVRSHHAIVSFAAVGANAEFLTRNAPFHYPLGSESPLARLHQLDGYVLLIGVKHDVNSSLHLAECWANVPYIHRYATVRTGPEQWTRLQGSPECSEGFLKIEPLLRQSRVLKQGHIGNAPSQLMRQQHLVSMAITMLQGNAEALLCDSSDCPWCRTARKFTAGQRTD